ATDAARTKFCAERCCHGHFAAQAKIRKETKHCERCNIRRDRHKPVNTAKMPMVAENEARRPTQSETLPQNKPRANAPINPTVANRPDCAGPRPNSRAIGGSAAPNKAKSAASNMTPKKPRIKKSRCHFENGKVSSRATSSADFASSTFILSSPK